MTPEKKNSNNNSSAQSKMKNKKNKLLQSKFVLERLKKRYPVRETHLIAHSPWELLVATILSAQCTDVRVNMVTPAFFKRWEGPAELANAKIEDVETMIRSTGFYRNKAKNLVKTATLLMKNFGGCVPSTMEELISLSGVARKTANVVLWGAFGINEGIAVDTHVGRIARRIGLVSSMDPAKTEKELMELFPRKEWGDINHMLVWFGRHVCDARKPLCYECELLSICEQNNTKKVKEKNSLN